MTPALDWLPTACISASATRHRRASRRSPTGPHPATRRNPGFAGHLQIRRCGWDHRTTGFRPSELADAPPSRYLREIDWDTAIVEIAEGFNRSVIPTADKIFYYGGGGQGIIGGAYSGAFRGHWGRATGRMRAGAGEDRREAWVDFSCTAAHTRRVRERRGRCLPGKNYWMSLPAGLSCSRDRQGSRPVDDDRSRRHRHREDGRSSTVQIIATLLAALAAVLVQKTSVSAFLPRTCTEWTPCAPPFCKRSRSPTTRSAAGWTRSCY